MTIGDALRDSTVVVTGGAGFIGSHLVARLGEVGVGRVIVLDSFRYGNRENLDGGGARVDVVEHTLGTDAPEALADVLAGADYLVHLAAEKHNQSKDEPARVYRANVIGTHWLFDAAARAGVRKILFSSSLYAYGRMSGPPFVETERPLPRTVYGVTKLAGEHQLEHFRAARGTRFDVVRYLFVYGPKQFAGMGYKSVVAKTFERLARGERPIVYGDGEQALDYVYVADAVEASLQVLVRPGDGDVFNVGSGRSTTVNELIDTMIRVSGRKVGKERGAADWTAGSWRVGNVDHIANVVGWRPTTSLSDGLERTWRWLTGD